MIRYLFVFTQDLPKMTTQHSRLFRNFFSMLTMICRISALLLSIAGGVTILGGIINHRELITPESPLGGIDYLPPLWVMLFCVVPALLWLGSFKKISAAVTIGIGIGYFVLFGDYRLSTTSSPEISTGDLSTLHAAVYNVQYYRKGFQKVFATINELNTDITLLCENVLQPGQLQEAQMLVAPNHFICGRNGESAIVSRYPVIDFREVDLPSYQASLHGPNNVDEICAHTPRRSFLHARLNFNGTTVHVLALRLIAGRAADKSFTQNVIWGKYLLKTQMQEIAFIESYIQSIEGPIIFGGDLNIPPSSRITRRLNRLGTDIYMATNHFGDFTFKTKRPTMRLDYLYCSDHFTPHSSEVVKVYSSDHFPVRALVSLRPQPLQTVLQKTAERVLPGRN
jgi:endonuclease/exonuclease/phosphatase (EEP) superfamily protein YafD